jgi:hypothetical protein
MNKLLALSAIIEAATGVALIADPPIVGRLLLGTELTGVTVAVGRVAGIGLFSLGVACWPGKEATRTALCAMLTYNLFVALYLLYLGVARYPDFVIGALLAGEANAGRDLFQQTNHR